MKNLKVLFDLPEAAHIVTFVLWMTLSASTAAATTWIGPLVKKNKEILRKSKPDTKESTAWEHNSFVCPVLPFTQQLVLLEGLLG